jgi:hypothetical protein
MIRLYSHLLLIVMGVLSANGHLQQDRPASPATVVSVPNLIRKPEHLFNLQGKTLRFVPLSQGGYRVATLPDATLISCPHSLTWQELVTEQGKRTLPFAFSYGGRSWRQVYVKLNGCVSFGDRESVDDPAYSPWADGGMMSMAADHAERSAAGQECLIAPLWAVNDPAYGRWQLSTREEPNRFVVTWDVQRVPWGHAVEGRNRFQLRLYADGKIEMAYARVPRKDGVVGLFPGTSEAIATLDHAPCHQDPSGAGLQAVDVVDSGATLKFVFRLRDRAPQSVAQGSLVFQVSLADDVTKVEGWLTIADRPSFTADLDASPRMLGYRIEGDTVAIYIAKSRMAHPRQLRWTAYVTRNHEGRSDFTAVSPDQNPRSIRLTQSQAAEPRLTPNSTATQGTLYEAFHYIWISKNSREVLKSIYARRPEDDLAVIFTDFRIDDLFAQGPSTGPLNVPIKGIGARAATPESTRQFGYEHLQSATTIAWVGSPFFSEHGPDEFGESYTHFARGISWLAHELSHRWGPELRFRNPVSGKEEALCDSAPHWLPDLYAPALVQRPATFPNGPQSGYSIMAAGVGTEWRQEQEGVYRFRRTPWWRNPGYSALDLYVMGLLPPEQVPETYLMQNIEPIPGGMTDGGWSPPVKAVKAPVRIQDIIAVMGERAPDSQHSQKEFRLGVYLLHRPDKEVAPEMEDRANRLALELADFLERATGRRMKVILTGAHSAQSE